VGKDLALSIFTKSDLPVAPEDSSQTAQPGKTRILLAEDNHINKLIALDQLLKLGYAADVVPNGLEVLEALKLIPYDIIFMDCQMPEMDGYDAASAIRLQEQTSGSGYNWNAPVYIVAITAHAMKGDRDKCLAAGMDDYLSKPIRLPELQAALKRWKARTRTSTNSI
jgi:CheY-like chemotaxis protein